MRLISKKTKCGLRDLCALARKYGKGYTLVSTLSEEEVIPKTFLACPEPANGLIGRARNAMMSGRAEPGW